MRYLLDAALFAVVFSLMWNVFDSPGYALMAAAVVAGAWEALQGKRAGAAK